MQPWSSVLFEFLTFACIFAALRSVGRHTNSIPTPADVKQLLGKDVELKCHADGQTYRVPNADTHPCDPSHVLDSDDIAVSCGCSGSGSGVVRRVVVLGP